MANPNVWQVASSGGDYTSLSAAEGDNAGDMVTATEGEQFNCEDFADTTACLFGGWTSDATYYLRVFAVDNHGGSYSTSSYRLEINAASAVIDLQDGTDNAHIRGIQLSNAHDTGSGLFVKGVGAGQPTIVEKCILRNTEGAPTSGSGMYSAATGEVKIINTLIYDFYRGFHSDRDHSSHKWWLYNCTAYGMVDAGFRVSGTNAVVIAKNCLANGNGTDFTTLFDTGSVNNASEDGTEPGTSGQTGAVSFANEGADDFHLAASGADTVAQDNGVDLSADGDYAFSDDIDGDTRTFWSIGIDDGSASAGTRRVMVVS